MYALFTAIPFAESVGPLLRQAEELQRHGWRVALASAREMAPFVEAEAPTVPFADIGTLGPIADAISADVEAAAADPGFLRQTQRILRMLSSLWPPMFDGLTNLVTADRPDVMVVDFFSSSGLSVAEVHGIPVVINNPDLLACLPATLLPPADWVPYLFSGKSISEVPWHQRLTAPFVRRLAAAGASLTVGRDVNAMRRTRRLPRISLNAMLSGKPILVNSVFGLEYERPLPPDVEMVGPMIPHPAPPLDAELAEWIAGGPPVVHVSLGTSALSTGAQLATITAGLDSDAFRALWTIDPLQAGRLPARRPAGLRLLDIGPSTAAILSQPNVRLSVSHCSVHGAHEALATGTPIVGIPMLADQRDMAVRVADAGAGVWLDKTRLTAEALRSAIDRVLATPAYARNAAVVRAATLKTGGVARAAQIIKKTAHAREAVPA